MSNDDYNKMPERNKDEEKKRKERRLKRQKLLEEQKRKEEEKAKQMRILLFKLCFFLVMAFFIIVFFMAFKNGVAVDFMTHQSQKYLQAREYDKAYHMLKIAETMKEDNEDIIYLEVIALSKMPVTYKTLQEIYDISEQDDLEEASEYAYNVLCQIRQELDQKIGDNYIDNVLYDNILYRWNNKNTISYSIDNRSGIPQAYINEIRRAFTAWSALGNGLILFKESMDIENADIIVRIFDMLPSVSGVDYDTNNRSAVTIPDINNDKLSHVEIVLKNQYKQDNNITPAQFGSVVKTQVGHALGIGGYSFDENDVMHSSGDYVSTAVPNKSFTVRDFNTLVLLYKMVPDVINKPLFKEDYDELFFHNAITGVPGSSVNRELRQLMDYLNNNASDIPKWVDLAENYGRRKHYKHAITILKSVLPLVQDNQDNSFIVLYNIATNYYKMKDYKNASKYIKPARKLNSSDMDAIVLDTLIMLKTEDKTTAMTKLADINKRYPDNIEIALKLYYLYKKDKDNQNANQVINNLIKSNSTAQLDKRVQKLMKRF